MEMKGEREDEWRGGVKGEREMDRGGVKRERGWVEGGVR